MNEAIRRAISILAAPGQVIELRALGGSITSGYFDDYEELGRVASILDTHGYHGIYITLNPVSPALLSRRANRVKIRLARSDATTADTDITSRRWLPIDIDPVRPSGISSSEEEHRAALGLAEEISAFLSGLGFPDPVIADSGNGAHLLYRIDLPNDTASRDLIRGCLSSLDTRFSDETCTVDTANANAARIWKLYGTLSSKGDSTADRPHRRAGLITVPGEIAVVPVSLLTRLSGLFPSDGVVHPPDNTRHPIDLKAWLTRYLPGFREKPYGGGTLYLLDSCPFSPAHTDGAYAIQFANGGIFAGCHHTSCGGGVQRWDELRDRYEDRKESRKSPALHRGAGHNAPETGISPGKPDASDSSALHTDEAARILTTGEPLRYLLDTFARDHEGDRIVAECLIMSLASRSVINSKGLHVSITGESGKGKSHTIDTLLRQVPAEFRLDGRMSEKALFYITGMQPGTVIALDDHALSDQMQEILKGVTSSFQRPFVYHTVSKDRAGQVCIIPERCVWWVAKVEGTGDDQVFNRMLTCWIDDSEEQDRKVLQRTLEEARNAPISGAEERDEVLVCRQIWQMVDPGYVIIPYAHRIRFHSPANRRNSDMLLDLIRSHAILMQKQRHEEMITGVRCITANEEDFSEAVRLFSALNGECGGQTTKLTRREADLVAVIHGSSRPELTVNEIQQMTGWNYSTIFKLLNGYVSKGQTYSGLLAKCPAVSFLDRSVTTGDEGRSTQRRVRIYSWDPVLYDAWIAGCAVWLTAPSGDDPGDDTPGPGGDDPSVCGDAGKDAGMRKDAGDCRMEKAAESALNNKTNNNCTSTDQYAADLTSMKQGSGSGVTGDHHDPHLSHSPICRIAAQEVHLGSYGSPMENSGPDQYADFPARPPHPAASAAGMPIRPGDFIAVEGWPEKKPCTVCGRPYTQYQERMTRDRIAGPPRPNRMLCSVCYEAAQVRAAMEIRTIPGVIDITTLQKRSCPTGKCTVCHTGGSVWIDPGQQVGLCEACYQREQDLLKKGSDSPDGKKEEQS